MPTPAAQGVIEQGFVWHELPLQAGGMNPLADVILLKELAQLYRQLSPAIIHHVTIKPVLYGSIAARLTRVPAVVNALSGLGYLFRAKEGKARLLRIAISFLLRRALQHPNSTLILQNPDDYELFRNRGLASENQTTIIKGSGVDMSEYAPSSESPGDPVVILPSRMIWDKGIGEFVEAARILKSRQVQAQFVLAGSPDSNNPKSVSLDDLENWNREGIVEWWGFCKNMPSVFEQVHLVCLPSYYGEGVPKVLIEAASCEKPIVTTDMPGCREIVHDGINGMLVPPRNSHALAEAIDFLLKDRDTRQRMGKAGRRIVEAEFSLEAVLEATLDVYRQLLRRGNNDAPIGYSVKV
jgi:glycosyltransferase involved in cell wall biosynthesis